MSLNEPHLSAQELFLLEAWVAENPGSRLFIRLARAYLDLDRQAEAAKVLERGLVVMPEEVEARELLAQALEGMGNPGGALEQLFLAARVIGRQAGIFERMGELLQREGRAEEASWAARVAVDLAHQPGPAAPAAQPSLPPTATLAAIYAAQGHTDQAAAIYRQLGGKGPQAAAAEGPVVAKLAALGQAARRRSGTAGV